MLITKTKVARYDTMGIEYMVPNLWRTIKHTYDKDAEKGIKHWGKKCKLWYKSQVNSEANLVDVFTVGIPSLIGEGFTKETIHVEYEWRPPRCDICKFFGHIHDHYPNKVVSPPITNTLNVVTPTIEKTHVGFQTVGKKKKKKCKSKVTNGGQFAGPSVKRYELKANTSAPKKGATNVGDA
nr:zinc knuckle CX2CX4HX4C [Tanacetum cinerariifolium]